MSAGNKGTRPSGPVMEPTRAGAPELDTLGVETEAAPVRRPRDVHNGVRGGRECGVESEATHGVIKLALQLSAGGDGFALIAGPCADAAEPGARREIGIALRGGAANDGAFDTYLAVLMVPVEHGGGTAGSEEFAAFAAALVGVENNVAGGGVDALAEHDAGARMAGGIDGGEGKGVGVGLVLALLRGVKPVAEQREGLGWERVGKHLPVALGVVGLVGVSQVAEIGGVGWHRKQGTGARTGVDPGRILEATVGRMGILLQRLHALCQLRVKMRRVGAREG